MTHTENTVTFPVSILRCGTIPVYLRVALAYGSDPTAAAHHIAEMCGLLRSDGETPDLAAVRTHRWHAVQRGLLRAPLDGDKAYVLVLATEMTESEVA